MPIKRKDRKRRKTYVKPILSKKQAYTISLLLVVAAVITLAINPWIKITTKSIEVNELCIIPFNTIKLEGLESTSTKIIVRGVKAIYTKCSETSCPKQEKTLSETILSPKKTEVELGPSIIQNFVLDTDMLGSITPSVIESQGNGTLNLTWSYPTLQARASVTIIVNRLNIVFNCLQNNCQQIVEEIGKPSIQHENKIVYQFSGETLAKTIQVENLVLFKKELYYQNYGCYSNALEMGIKLNITVLLLLIAFITIILSRIGKTL